MGVLESWRKDFVGAFLCMVCPTVSFHTPVSRACAVNGGVYILGRKVISLQLPSGVSPSEATRASIRLEDIPDVLTADLIIASQEYLPVSNLPEADTKDPVYVCGIVIVDRPITFPSSEHTSIKSSSRNTTANDAENTASDQSQLDTVVVVFAPGSLPEGKASNVVRILQMGENTLSCPKGKCEFLHFRGGQADPRSLSYHLPMDTDGHVIWYS